MSGTTTDFEDMDACSHHKSDDVLEQDLKSLQMDTSFPDIAGDEQVFTQDPCEVFPVQSFSNPDVQQEVIISFFAVHHNIQDNFNDINLIYILISCTIRDSTRCIKKFLKT